MAGDRQDETDASVDDRAMLARTVELLGPQLTAYVLRGTEKDVEGWAEDTATLPAGAAEAVRELASVSELLAGTVGTKTTRAWWMGSSPELDDRSPASVLRSREPHPDLVSLARAFLEGSYA